MKTTIDVPESEWQEFSETVMRKHGNHKLNHVIGDLIRRVNKGEIAI